MARVAPSRDRRLTGQIGKHRRGVLGLKPYAERICRCPWPTGQARLVQGRSRRWESDPRLTRFADIMPQHPRSTPTFADWQAQAARLDLKREGRELVGPCPSCGGDDRFSVSAKNGRAVFQCRQCNPGRDNPEAFLAILKAAGFAEEREPSAKTRPQWKPDMIHVYRDPTGKQYHRVYRRGSGPDKDVWQDAGYEGSFYPYRVEQLPDWSDVPIVIVEGEKCADHLVRLEYAAVTWCGGAGQETRTKWGALAGHPVILWPDNDASGTSQDAIQNLARILDGLGCDLQLVSIPEGKPDKWDAADATEKEIRRLIAEAKPISGSDEFAPPKDGARGEINGAMFSVSMGDFLHSDIPSPTWLLQDMLTEAGLSILGAKPKVGKSTFTRSLAVSHREGREVPWSVHQTRAGLLWRLRGRSLICEGAPSGDGRCGK